jgi:hypothetical protein
VKKPISAAFHHIRLADFCKRKQRFRNGNGNNGQGTAYKRGCGTETATERQFTAKVAKDAENGKGSGRKKAQGAQERLGSRDKVTC